LVHSWDHRCGWAIPGLPRKNANWSVVSPQSAFSLCHLPPDSAAATSSERFNYDYPLPAAWSDPFDSAFTHSPSFASPGRQDRFLNYYFVFLFLGLSCSFSFESIFSYVGFETRSFLNSQSICSPCFVPGSVFSPSVFNITIQKFFSVYVRGKRHAMTRQRRPLPSL
jgi:hypothetical protein